MTSTILLGIALSLITLGCVYAVVSRAPTERNAKEKNIPLIGTIDNLVMEANDGLYVVLEFEGSATLFTPEPNQIEEKRKRTALITNTIPEQATVYSYRIRDKAAKQADRPFANKMSREIDLAWREKVDSRSWRDRLFLCVYYPYSIKKLQSKDERAYITELLNTLVDEISSDFSEYGVSPVLYNDGGRFSPILSFWNRVINLENLNGIAPIPSMSFKSCLSIPQTLFNKKRFTVLGNKKNICGVVRVQDYSDATAPYMLAELESIQSEYIICQTFKAKDSSIYVESISREIKLREKLEDKAQTTLAELYEVRDLIASNKLAVGDHQFTLIVQDDDSTKLSRNITTAMSALKRHGIQAREEISIALPSAYYGLIPGNQHYLTRKSDITARNFASFMTFNAVPKTTQKKHFLGAPETQLESLNGTLKDVTLYNTDVGNAMIIGSNGTGKTVLANFLASQMNHLGHRYYCCDLDKSSQVPLEAHGGQYIAVDPGTPFCNPLMLEGGDSHIDFLKRFIKLLAGTVTHSEEAIIHKALDATLRMPRELRTLSSLCELLKGSNRGDDSIYVRLLKWTKSGGQYGWLFDHDNTIALSPETTYYGFDITKAYDDDAITAPIAFLVFHIIEMDTQRYEAPFTIAMEELWRALDNEYTQYKVKKYEKTSRKQKGRLIVITQDPEDLVNCGIGKSIVGQTSTWFIYPGDSSDDAYSFIGLSMNDIELLRSIPQRARQFLYKNGDTSIPLKFNFAGVSLMEAVLPCNKERVALQERMKQQHGRNWFAPYAREVANYG